MRIDQACRGDIPAIAAIFTTAFQDSVLHVCGRLPRPQAMIDVFTLVYEAEPAAAFVARDDAGRVQGYLFAPAHLPHLWWRAIAGGHICRWLWRWCTGRYGIGLYPVKVLLADKWAFLTSSWRRETAASARILSIAVAPAARGQGVASALMARGLAYFAACGVRRVRLEVRPHNAPARRVYDKYGFIPAGTTRDSQGDWLIMFKEM